MQGLEPIQRLVLTDLTSAELDPARMAESPAEADGLKDSVPSSSSQGSGGSGAGRGGTLRWIWSGLVGILFGRRNIDFEKRLRHLSKEEVTVHSRLKRRTHTWRRVARAIVLYSVLIEVLALGFALVSTRSLDIPWKLRAIRVFPVFAVPAIAALLYTACSRYFHMRERKDQRTLEKLRAERQARIDELKQRTNYYATQELIQRYDLDPTAKAAAASVLAAKLGAESGLNVAFKSSEGADSSNATTSANGGKTRSPETSSGLRQRKGSQAQTKEPLDTQGFLKALEDEVKGERETEALDRDAAMDRARGRMGGGFAAAAAGGGGGGIGWLARIAAMLVGEDPSQCYALICKNCHMHNGLAPKEEFQYVTYICPHCRALNGGRQWQSGENDETQRQHENQAAAVAAVAAAAAAASSSFTPKDSKQESRSSMVTAAQDHEPEIPDS
ncbi:uncharacterized protein At2g24330 [Selaginella moellendorffii]|uniref:uncharacterized protein At2g24330 n=1 Tax=Selaginella moellendorffii TaxID=88036 RepID=UPI000D1C345A|nr:uncharacterized protein At2g24330 [Selaginella moellendorffii]|eukprot:XP_024527983.1 uncharacterized protein At2g24330 [Selaginella moellendorffii]